MSNKKIDIKEIVKSPKINKTDKKIIISEVKPNIKGILKSSKMNQINKVNKKNVHFEFELTMDYLLNLPTCNEDHYINKCGICKVYLGSNCKSFILPDSYNNKISLCNKCHNENTIEKINDIYKNSDIQKTFSEYKDKLLIVHRSSGAYEDFRIISYDLVKTVEGKQFCFVMRNIKDEIMRATLNQLNNLISNQVEYISEKYKDLIQDYIKTDNPINIISQFSSETKTVSNIITHYKN